MRNRTNRVIGPLVLAVLMTTNVAEAKARAQAETAPQAQTEVQVQARAPDSIGLLSLENAIEQALSNGPRVRAAEAALDAGNAAAGTLTSAYLPSVSASASNVYFQYPTTVTPIRQPGVFPPLSDNIYELSLSASWTVFDFGRGRAARKSAQALAKASGVRYELARMEAIEAVTTYYVRLAQLIEVQQAQQQRLAALGQQEVQLNALYTEGRVPRVELLKIDEVILSAGSDLRKTQNDIEAILLALAADVGASQPLTLENIDQVELPSADVPVLLPTQGASSAPVVAMAEAGVDAAHFSAQESKRSFLPAVDLFAAERFRSSSDFSFDDDLYGGIRLRIPLFQPGRHAKRQVVQANVRQREAELETARNQIRVAFEDLINREKEAIERTVATEAQMRHLEETYRIETAAYNEGRLTLSDLLVTEARLSAGRSEFAAAKAAITLTRLHRSVLSGTLTPGLALHLNGL